jgi:hypothetical protein
MWNEGIVFSSVVITLDTYEHMLCHFNNPVDT